MKTFSEKVTWINIVNPSKKDIEHLRTLHNFHPIILDEIMQSSAHSRVEFYDNYLFMTYHLPVYEPAQKTSRRTEIDFLIMAGSVITIQYENLEPLESFGGLLESSADMRERALGKNTAVLTYYIIQSIINFSLRQLRHIEENIHHVSNEIFKDREDGLLERISYIKRDVLDYHLISRPQQIVLNSLRRAGMEFWGKKSEIYLNDLLGDDQKIQERVENYLKVIESLEETNAQILNAKINRSSQTFTILAFFTFPLVLFTSVYAIENRTQEFWTGFITIAIITIILPFLFKKRRVF